MFKKTVVAGLTTAALAAPAAALAQAPAAKPSTPTLDQVLDASGIAINGYIDVAYTHLSGNGFFTPAPGTTANRVFDTERNSFLLHQAAVTIAKQPKEGFGGLVNLIAGKDADVIAPYDTNPGAKNKFDVTQAFAQYAAGPLTVMGGKFVTLAGAEVIDSRANPNYSHSILFGYAIPFTHTGARASYAVSDSLTLMGGVNNGWDDLKDTNSGKTLELGVSFAPSKSIALGAQGYSGKERVGGLVGVGPEGTRDLIDLVATFNATDKLTLILNYDYATQENTATVTPNGASKAKWQGLAAYVNYQITDQWRLSVRGETFDDKDGYRTGVIQKWKEATFTVGYSPAKNFELKAEVRGDRSNVSAFVESNGVATSKSQESFGLQAIYKF